MAAGVYYDDESTYAYPSAETIEQDFPVASRSSGIALATSLPLQFSSKSLSSRTIGGEESDAAPPATSVRVQKDFVSTVMFETVLVEGGKARVNFTAPDSLSTFVVRAYAASGKSYLS